MGRAAPMKQPRNDAPEPASDTARTPLLWILVPAAAGIAFARAFAVKSPVAVAAAGLAFAAIAIYLSYRKSHFRHDAFLWPASTLLCAFFIFASYGSIRMRDRLEWCAGLPARAVTMEMRVETSYPYDKWGCQRGIAEITSAPQIQEYLVGQRVLFRVDGKIPVRESATLKVKGLIKRLPLDKPDCEAGSPDSFKGWLVDREVYFELKRAHIIAETIPPPPFTAAMTKTRLWMRGKLLEGSGKLSEIRAMVPAMLLGESGLLSPQDKAVFRTTGMMHLFAVSGLHVGLVAMTLEIILAGLRTGRRLRIPIALVILLGYVFVIGSPPSAVRAFLMIAFYRGGTLAGRPARGLPSLAASAVAVLVYDPTQLFDAGAQLSYGIVAGIMLYGVPLGKLLCEKLPLYEDLPSTSIGGRHLYMITARDWVAETIGVTIGAFAIGAPLSIQYFGNFSPGSLLLNILMIPLAMLSAVASVITIIFASIALLPHMAWIGGVGVFFNYADWACAWEMHELIATISDIPLFFFKVSYPAQWCGPLATVTILSLMILLRERKLQSNLLWMLSPVIALAGIVTLSAI
jgi:competence protein ComEC